MTTTAKDLGPAGWDSSFGYGLIQIGPGVVYALGNRPTPRPTATNDVVHPNATQTPTDIPYGFYPTAMPTFTVDPLAGLPSATVTPGEISMQALPLDITIDSTETPTDVEAELDHGAGRKTETDGLLLAIGIFYITMGVGLFIFARKRYDQWMWPPESKNCTHLSIEV
jgi:hypothetical protein